MIFEADLGNTRLKWRLLDGVEVDAGVCDYSELDRIPVCSSVRRVRASAVVSQNLISVFSAWAAKAFAVEVELARVSETSQGVLCAYRDNNSFGVDRWLALQAAKSKFCRPLIVVDCGTAITVDVLGRGGEHMGGYILPGFELMHKSLLAGTADLTVQGEIARSIELGRNTEGCMSNGILMSVVGLLRELMRQQQLNAELLLVVTGGAGEQLLSFFPGAKWEQSLVLDGLAVALP